MGINTWYLVSFRGYGRLILQKYDVFNSIQFIWIVFWGKAWLCLPLRSPDMNTGTGLAPRTLPVHLMLQIEGMRWMQGLFGRIIWKRAAVACKPGTPPTVLRHTINMATMDDVVKSSLLFLCLFSMLLQPGSTGSLRVKRQTDTSSK